MVELHTPPVTRRPAILVAVICAVTAAVLGVWFAGDRGPSAFDAMIQHAIDDGLGRQRAVLRLFLLPTQPYVLLPVIVLILLVCALSRQWPAAALGLLGPALTVAMNMWLLKPLFDRHYNDGLAYPSGHTVSLVSTLAVLVLLARPGTAARLAYGLSVLLVVAAGIGLIGNGYHYATDVIGGACFAVAAVIGLAIGIEAITQGAVS